MTLFGVLAAQSPAEAEPPRYDPKRATAQRDALGILRHGHDYFEGVELPGDRWSPETTFKRIDAPLAAFLEFPQMHPAVQFSCAVMSTPGEERLTKALAGRNDRVALLALAALLRVHSPSTVAEQTATIARLGKSRPKWKATLEVFERRFDPKALAASIAHDPPVDDRYGDAPTLLWSIRAVGVRQHKSALPRLATLCTSDHLYTSLAAERSIEDFTGPKADAALATCVEGWQYNAADRALAELRDRNPALARSTLLAMPVPGADELYRYAAAVVRVADASAVPRLIEIIPTLDDPAGSIGALERHAQPKHRDAVRALIPLVVEAEHKDQLTALAKRLAEQLAEQPSPGATPDPA